MCLTACAQKKGGERGPRQGGHMEIRKDSDSTFVALKNETLKKFKQLTFNDTQTGKTMEYNLLIPEGAEAGHSRSILHSYWFRNIPTGPCRMIGAPPTRWR